MPFVRSPSFTLNFGSPNKPAFSLPQLPNAEEGNTCSTFHPDNNNFIAYICHFQRLIQSNVFLFIFYLKKNPKAKDEDDIAILMAS